MLYPYGQDIEGTDIYKITGVGDVINTKSNTKMRIQNNNGGKLSVSIRMDGKYKKMYIHRLVALAYIPNPESKPQVDHIDGDNSNNIISNLRWCTNEENQNYRDEQGVSGKEGISKKILYDGIEYKSIKSLSRILAEERGSKQDTIRKAIKAARHGEICLYGKKCRYI